MRIAKQDQEELLELVNQGLYLTYAEAGRDAVRRGIEDIKKRRAKNSRGE